LLLGGVTGVIAIVRLTVAPLVPVRLPVTTDVVPSVAAPRTARAIAADSVTLVVARDPFRAARRPAFPPYDPLRLAELQAPPPPRPMLLLVGVVNGTQPSAVVDGLPGVEGSRVMRVGDVVAGLRVKEIRNSRVVIAGMDTTWVLEVREPWKD
jgi:hypothetical protein